MGRSIIADESVQKYIEKLAKENKWFIGVIIGQLTSQRDYVVHLARTPDPVEDEVSEENGEEDGGDGVVNVRQKSVVERPASLEELDEKWVSTHAKQVSRMLPGGLSVVGLFAIAPPAMLKAAQTKLRQMMSSVYKQLSKTSLTSPAAEITDRILLQMDTSTKKLTCVTVDIADFKSAPRPAEWKFQSGGSKWVRLNSNINLDIPITVPQDSKAQSLLKQIQVGLADFGSWIQTSVVTVGGAVRAGSEPLVAQGEKKGKGKGSAASQDECTSFDVGIFLPFVTSEVPQDPVVGQSQATINMVGTSVVRAFVSARATVADAIEAVKTDVLRSIMARCELLCEEFDVAEVTQGRSEVYDPPVRLFCRLPHTAVQVCDYVFQDEKTEEVKGRIQELLDIQVEELEEAEKSAADDDTWSQPSLPGVVSSQSQVAELTEKKSSVRAYLGAAVGGAVAAIAAGISYIYLNE
ncbi:protein odr-4 homolog [Aplysia californica]|uniref:Protein odr-4 homolog n=1 Tax=Aplysia californica TaxID=6500 RepID=A0ABM0JX59_APLCA|nr:protein odr-4 homolog [Aplysia californica]